MNVEHSCPADGTEHESSADCHCGPIQVSDTEWQHFGADAAPDARFAASMRNLGWVSEKGANAVRELREALAHI